jgi:hypothetical protein
MFVSSSGNVGIGTTSPSYKLDISGSVRITGSLNVTEITSSAASLTLQQTGDSFGTTQLQLLNRNTQGGAFFKNLGLDLVDFGFITNTTAQGNLRFDHRTGNILPLNTTGEFQLLIPGSDTNPYFQSGYYLTSLSQGNLLIGTTTNSGYKLDISGSARIVNGNIIITGSSAGATNYIDIDTNGIGAGVGNIIKVKDSTSNPSDTYFFLKANTNNYRGFEMSYVEGTKKWGILGSLYTGLAIYAGTGTGTNEVARFADQSGNLLLNKTTDAGYRLDVAGTAYISASSNNNASSLTVQGSGSANPVFKVVGSQGELFSITDSLSGSLFSVNDVSGLPILEVFSDQTTLIGSYLAPSLYTTTKITANTGVTKIYTLPTSSYDGVYVDYTIRSGSNARAGQLIAMWSGSSMNYTEVSASQFGTTTTQFKFDFNVSSSYMLLSGSATSDGWTVKTIIRSI